MISPSPLNGEYSVVQLPSLLAKRILAGSHTPDSQKIHSGGHLFRQRRRQLEPPFVMARDWDGIDRVVRFGFQKCRGLQGDKSIIPDN